MKFISAGKFLCIVKPQKQNQKGKKYIIDQSMAGNERYVTVFS